MSFRYQFCDVKYYDLMYGHVSVVKNRDNYATWYIKKAFSIFSATTAAKRSSGDVFRRESVLSDDRVCDRLSKFFKV